jgi:hypothetical protein
MFGILVPGEKEKKRLESVAFSPLRNEWVKANCEKSLKYTSLFSLI